MTNDIKFWLEELGLAQYAESFAENDVDIGTLPDLSDADLADLGVSLGHRKRMLRTIRDSGSADDANHAPGDAERRQLTVMFCDLVGSTKLSVRMDPEELRDVISNFQKRCAMVAQSFGGNVARYMGDGLLIYFGYPRANEHDPESAVHAGLEIIKAVHSLDVVAGTTLQTRVGIATGEVVVGDLIGAGSARERSVIGETPNLAARLQGLADPDQVVVSDVTRKLARGLFEFHSLGLHSLKGFDASVKAWRVERESAIESRFEAIHPVEKLSPLISRSDETDRLMRSWGKAVSGTGQAVLVRGEPGIGKSRMVHMLRQQIAPVPHNLLRYCCAPNYQNTALFPMIRQLEGAAGFASEDDNSQKLTKLEALIDQAGGDIAEVAPFLAALLSVPAGDRYPDLNLSPQRWLERTLQALRSQLTDLAKDRPVLMLFEDLHWIDPTSLELLKKTVEAISEMPVMLLMTSRPEFESPWAGAVDEILLDRLGRDDSAALASQLASGRTLPVDLVDLIVEKTDGVPLFIEELAKMILESGILEEDGDSLILSGPLPELTLPNTLQDLLMAKLDRLAGAKELAQIGATIGRQFSYKLLSKVSRLAPEELSSGLEKLVAADIVTISSKSPELVYKFRHALIQDSAYSSLLKLKRKKLHASIAGVLEEHFPDIAAVRPETLAHHFTRAEQHDSGIEYWHRAANMATDRAAHLDAIQHVGKALELLNTASSVPDTAATEIGLRVTLGRNQEAVFGYAAPQVEDTFARARELCQRVDDPTLQVPVLLGLCVFNLVRANCSVARELAEQCIELSKEAGQIDYLIESYAVLAFALCYLGEQEASHNASEKCISLYESRGDDVFISITAQNPAVAVLSTDAIVLWQMGFVDQSMQKIEAALALAERLEHPINYVQIYTHAAELYQLRGEPEKAKEQALQAIKLGSAHGYDYWQLLSTLHLGIAMGALGKSVEASTINSEALDALRGAGANTNLTYFLGGIAQGHLVAGDADKGLVLLNSALEQAARTGEMFHSAMLHILRGDCYLALPIADPKSAEDDYRKAIEIAQQQGIRTLLLRANIHLYRLLNSQGLGSTAIPALRAAAEAISEGVDSSDMAEAKVVLAASA